MSTEPRKLTTWSINGMGGPISTGIPSLEVAKTLAIDLFRYDPYPEDNEPWRCDVRIETLADEDYDAFGDTPRVAVYVDGKLAAGVNPEHRCSECRVVPQRSWRGVR